MFLFQHAEDLVGAGGNAAGAHADPDPIAVLPSARFFNCPKVLAEIVAMAYASLEYLEMMSTTSVFFRLP